MIFAFEQAVVCDLREYFLYSTTIRIKSCVVHFLCWEPAFRAVALDTMGEGGTVEQGAELCLGVLDGDVMRAVVRWCVWSVHVHVRVYMGMSARGRSRATTPMTYLGHPSATLPGGRRDGQRRTCPSRP